MHIGNLRTALYEYLIAKRYGGIFILRIEDTDRNREVYGAVEKIRQTLRTAGLAYDEGPDAGGEFGPYVQSERVEIYMRHAQELVDKGKAYYCFCDKKRLESLDDGLGNSKYDRRCLNLSKEEVKRNLDDGIPWVIRQLIPEGDTAFVDQVYGEITISNSELDDQILIKSDGMPTYNFANVVDDHLMLITHVVRGNEYLSSTPKYNLLYDAFGWQIPTYIHLPLILNEKGEKLSKRRGDASFEDLLEAGFLPEAIVNCIALLGWSPSDNQEIFSLEELSRSFDLKGLSKSPSTFDVTKLTWMNGEYFRRMDPEKFYELSLGSLKESVKLKSVDLKKVAELVQPRINFIHEIPALVDFIDALPEYDASLYTHKKMKTNSQNSLESLKKALQALESLDCWDEQSLHARIFKLIEELGIKNGQMLWPIRTALSGKPSSPCGATELCALLGRDLSLKRLRLGIEKLISCSD
jgi:glutamyl-tRNA synthetase